MKKFDFQTVFGEGVWKVCTTTVTFTNVKKGTWYVTIRAWNQTSKDKSRVYNPYSAMKKFKTKK
ncbi:MAG: hypothetical protein E7F06_08790 [Lachnospiraceae bacterium]|nr:hypothetical protein [Lachnospiraceae bacterium]